MFLVIIFLSLAAVGAYLFPDGSGAAILAGSFACVAIFRLILFFIDRRKRGPDNKDQP